MIDSQGIFRQANQLVRRFSTRQPEIIAKGLGIRIFEESDFKDLLGMYTVRWKHRMIFVNQNIDPILRKMVIAHELGHDALHRNLPCARGLQEFTLFNMTDTTEYEANAFAAHILLDTDEIVSLIHQGRDVVQIAQILNTNINLALIKIQEMNRLGYNFCVPITPDSCFFRKIDS